MKSAFWYFILLIVVETRLAPATINLVAGYAVIPVYKVNKPDVSSE